MRAASYCRVSSDKQSMTSVNDQKRLCSERIAREGWTLVEEYHDYAMSGASAFRPGLQRMLADAKAGKLDALVIEALDRVSRSLRDTADIYQQLSFYGVRIVSLNDGGEISSIHVGIGGIVNSEFLRNLAHKTHRGVQGRVLAGKNVTRKTYGYRIIRRMGDDGQVVRGEIEIDEAEAAIVRRIYTDADENRSAKKIATQLNAEGVPGPTGGEWSASAIYGCGRKGNGILRQKRYVGIVEWNRTTWKKHPDTGRRISRLNSPDAITAVDAPELRIVP